MPPARPRPDDSRSETSSVLATQKERSIIGGAVTKSKKHGTNVTSDATSTFKTAAVNGALAVHNATVNGTGAPEPETQPIDWNTMPISTLHAYRAAHRLNTPAAYTRPHAELIYNSSDLARSAPSQVRARKKALQLQAHRKKVAQASTTNGVAKTSKKKVKDKDNLSDNSSRDGRRKQVDGNTLQPLGNGDTIAQSIEPTSPTIESASASSDTAPSSLLNSANPEATIIGRQSPISLANTVRKHFNAQNLNEAETIARFTYVMRQQGYGNATLGSSHSNSNTTSSSFVPRTAAPIRVEGSEGDGSGSIMGSMGREEDRPGNIWATDEDDLSPLKVKQEGHSDDGKQQTEDDLLQSQVREEDFPEGEWDADTIELSDFEVKQEELSDDDTVSDNYGSSA